MADNVTTQSATLATPPASTVIATDQLGTGEHVQKIKLLDGTADSAVAIPGDATNGLDVDVTRVSGNVTVVQGTAANLKVDASGATVPVSAAALPLPTGAATAAKQPALGTAGTASTDVISVQGVSGMTAVKTDGSAVTQPVSGTVTVQQPTASSLKVDLSGTAANATAIKTDGSAVTQPVSASSLPLPTGAATAAKQPALGTAGSASTDVITVQGIASGTALSTSNTPVSPSSVLNGNTNVTTAGTRVTLAASTTCRSVTVRAKHTNTGVIYVGNSSVSSSNGYQLLPGESISLDITNLNTVNLDAATSGEGVTYLGVA